MPDPLPKPQPRFRLAPWQIACLVLASLILIFILWRLLLLALVDHEIDHIRAQGLPTSYAEMNKYDKIPPPESNGAILYQRADASITPYPRDIDPRHHPISSGTLATGTQNVPQMLEFRDFFAKNKLALDLCDQAAAQPESRYSVDYTVSPSVDMNLVRMETLGNFMSQRALYAVESDDCDSAAHWLCQNWAFTQSFASEPQEIVQFSRRFWDAQNVEYTQRALNHLRLSQTQLASIASRLDAIQYEPDLNRSLAYTQVSVIRWFTLHNANSLSETKYFLYTSTGVRELDELKALQLNRQTIELYKLRGSARIRAAALLDHQIASLPAIYVVSCNSSSDLEGDFREIDAHATTIQCLRVAVAVERYRRENQEKSPRSLNDLVPRFLPHIPTDPDGVPLVFDRQNDAFDAAIDIKSPTDSKVHVTLTRRLPINLPP